jgi:hypothetical protein
LKKVQTESFDPFSAYSSGIDDIKELGKVGGEVIDKDEK